MFSENVTVSESLFISAFAMVMVFLILLAISCLIDLVAKALLVRKPRLEGNALPSSSGGQSVSSDSGIDSATIAIISAAIDSHEKGKRIRIASVSEQKRT